MFRRLRNKVGADEDADPGGDRRERIAARGVLNAALAANDRVKYAFSLLQMAVDHAEHPEQPAATLKRERIACGIDEPDFDACVAGARMVGKSCRVAGAARIIARIADDMRPMAAPVLATKPDGLAARLDGLLGALPAAADDLLDPDAISAMTQIGPRPGRQPASAGDGFA